MNKQTETEQADIPAVIARPPYLFLGALLLGFVWDFLLPLPFLVPGPDVMHWVVGGVLIAGGFAVFVSGIRNFLRADTPVPGNQPTRVLVTAGIHGITRNPIYLGMFLIYVGIGLAAQSAWVLLITVPLAITMRYGVVAREEVYLERRFGDAYRAYKGRVRRWL